MADEKSKVIIEAQDKASKTIKEIAGNFGELVAAVGAGNLVSQAATKVLSSLKRGFDELVDATKVAARIEVLNRVFRMTGENAGYTSAQLENTKNRMMALGIAEQEALAIGQRFIQSQLDLADAMKVARAAQDLAVIAGTNSSETALQLTDAIVKQRPILLKQFGIIADLNDIYGAQAKTLRKSIDELTTAEKRQAFLNEILRQSRTVAGSYEAAMEDVGKRLTSLPRYLQQAQNAVGQHFLPAMRLAVDGATEFLKTITVAFAPKIDTLIGATNKLAETRMKFDATSERVRVLRDEYAALIRIAEPTASQHERMTVILGELEKAFPGVVLGIESETTAMRSNLEVLDDLIARREEQQERREAEQLAAVQEEYIALARDVEKYGQQLEYARDVVFATTTASDEQRQALIAKHQAILEASGALGGFSQAQDDAQDRIAAMTGSFRPLVNTLRNDYQATVNELPGQIDELTKRQDRLKIALSNLFPDLVNDTDAQKRLNKSVVDAVMAFQASEAAAQKEQEAQARRAQMVDHIIERQAGWSEATKLWFTEEQQRWIDLHASMSEVPEDYRLMMMSQEQMADTAKMTIGEIDQLFMDSADAQMDGARRVLNTHHKTVMKRRQLERQAAQEMAQMMSWGVDRMIDDMLRGQYSMQRIFRDMAHDFLRFFVKQALKYVSLEFIPGLGKLLGSIFDTPANDRMAMMQGQHFAQWFKTGALGSLAGFPNQMAASLATGLNALAMPAAPAAAGGGGVTINISGPMTDERFITDKVIPAIQRDTILGRSQVVINQANLTGFDDASIV